MGNDNQLKAWMAVSSDGDFATIVFAENRGKAKALAMLTDTCCDMAYTDIRVYRTKDFDCLYDGKWEIDYYNDATWRKMVEHGWRCAVGSEDYEECLVCPANDICEEYKEHKNKLWKNICEEIESWNP